MEADRRRPPVRAARDERLNQNPFFRLDRVCRRIAEWLNNDDLPRRERSLFSRRLKLRPAHEAAGETENVSEPLCAQEGDSSRASCP